MLLDMEELVKSGSRVRWIDAQHDAEQARKIYRSQIITSERRLISAQK